jgi:hypothetical protein
MYESAPAASRSRGFVERIAPGVFVLVAVALVAGFFLEPAGDQASLRWFSDLSLTAVSVGGGMVTLLTARALAGRDRLAWALIGGGILSWGLGQVAWTYMELVLGMYRPFPSIADAGYLPLIPLMFAGLLLLPGNTSNKRGGWQRIGLDAFIVMACVLTLSWFGLLGPIYIKAHVSWAEKFFGLVYPAGDILLLFGLIGGIARGSLSGRNPIVVPLMIGIALFIGADLGFTALTINDQYETGSLIDLGWPLGLLSTTYAAVLRWTHCEAAEAGADEQHLATIWAEFGVAFEE